MIEYDSTDIYWIFSLDYNQYINIKKIYNIKYIIKYT